MPERVVLITAGSAGLGAQIARVLAPDFRVVCRRNSLPCRRELANFPSSVSTISTMLHVQMLL
jgi:NAD(P)-dependent dehydrogenase (short-subunit alcohol dehydrogenase family)